MAFTLDIDTGGTFTDGFVVHEGGARTVKVPTTPHDLTICFLETITAAANSYDVSVEDFLFHTDIIRFSNTIGTNTIIQRDGSKIGLLTSIGMSEISPTHDNSEKKPLVEPDMVIELEEKTDNSGKVIHKPDPIQVLQAVQTLIDQGAVGIVVSFANSHLNVSNEQLIRKIVKTEYPRDYLGSVSVFLSSDISARTGLEQRLNSAVLNAYIHSKLTRLLYKAGEDLRQKGYRKTLFIGHNNASVARVAKTRAINTYNSGPAAGLLGAREIGALYGIENLISTDMGGTSFDIGYVRSGQASYTLEPDIEGFACNLPMMAIKALGTGGGSIAHIKEGTLQVGPQSAGALPGPACFNLGGSKPTVTDANLVLGVLDPDYFLGGSMKLDVQKARNVIQQMIAEPLGLSIEDAASEILEVVNNNMGMAVSSVAENFSSGETPVIFAYGGAGGLHACGIASKAQISKVIMTPFSSVSSAYSSSLMDAGHLYYNRVGLELNNNLDRDHLIQIISDKYQEAIRDMRGEGFKENELDAELQLFVRSNEGSKEQLIKTDTHSFNSQDALSDVIVQATTALNEAGENTDNGIQLETLALIVSAKVPHYEIPILPESPVSLEKAIKSSRPVYVHSKKEFIKTPIYDRDKLGRDNAVTGPGLIESDLTTILIHEGWKMTIDQYNNAIMEGV